MSYAIYTPTGMIDRIITGDESYVTSNLRTGEAFLPLLGITGDDSSLYVDLSTTPQVLPKQDYTLEALPMPCTLTIDGTDYPVTEQPTLTFVEPGVYDILVDAGPQYLTKTFQVTQV